MGKGFVTFKVEEVEVKKGKLDLSEMGIIDISEIEGLEYQTDLKGLYLSSNKIEEIKGLENLKNLRELDLSDNYIQAIKGLENLPKLEELGLGGNFIEEIGGLENLTELHSLYLCSNKIKEVKGLENLTKLEEFGLYDNELRDDEKYLVYESAQEVVKYCQKKVEKAKREAKKYIVDREKIYPKLRFVDVASKFEVSVEQTQELFEELLITKKLEGTIDLAAKEFIIGKREKEAKPKKTLEKMKSCYSCGAILDSSSFYCAYCGEEAVSEEITRPKIVLKEEAFICDICKQIIREDIVNCPNCMTPFHYECLGEWIKSGHPLGGKCPRCKVELAFKY